MSDGQTSNHKTKWLAVIIPILSAAFAVVGFIYYIGQRGSKISEVVEWKKEMAPTDRAHGFHRDYIIQSFPRAV